MYQLLSKEEMQELINSAAFNERVANPPDTPIPRPSKLHGVSSIGLGEDNRPIINGQDNDGHWWVGGDDPEAGLTELSEVD